MNLRLVEVCRHGGFQIFNRCRSWVVHPGENDLARGREEDGRDFRERLIAHGAKDHRHGLMYELVEIIAQCLRGRRIVRSIEEHRRIAFPQFKTARVFRIF